MDTVDNAITKPVHRLEVFTGAGRRRTWSDEDKARIVAEIAVSGESVSAVARRHPNAPSAEQIFKELTGKAVDEHFWTSPESAATGVRNVANRVQVLHAEPTSNARERPQSPYHRERERLYNFPTA